MTDERFSRQGLELPRVPYNRIDRYTDLLGNPNDYPPQIQGVVVQNGARVYGVRQRKLPDLRSINPADPFQISLASSAHVRFLGALASATYEHLNLATTGVSLGGDDFLYYQESFDTEKYYQIYPDPKVKLSLAQRSNRVYAIFLDRGRRGEREVKQVLHFSPYYRRGDNTVYPAGIMREFSDIVVSFIDKNPATFFSLGKNEKA